MRMRVGMSTRQRVLITLCSLFAALILLPTEAANADPSGTNLGSLVVDGKDNIFGAGHASAPNGGLTPVKIPLPRVYAGQAIALSNAAGGVTMGVNAPSPGPDGGYDPDLSTNVTSLGGISGVIGDPGLGAFLGGVFTSDVEPNSAATPKTLDYSAAARDTPTTTKATTNAVLYNPAVDQLFFMGDGLTSFRVRPAVHRASRRDDSMVRTSRRGLLSRASCWIRW